MKPVNHNCPNCGVADMSVFYELNNVPAHSVLRLPTRQEAIDYPKGDIKLAFCDSCGFISNIAFDSGLNEYSNEYDPTQSYSGTFSAFHRRLAQQLIDTYDLHHKRIIEIGCGQGEFLTLLCELGENQGIGFDPAYVGNGNNHGEESCLTFIQDFYSDKYAHYQGDFICCKMTLEHISQTADFVGMVQQAVQTQTEAIIFFQVPDVVRILREAAFWDIYYEHCSYFSPASLARLFFALWL